MKRFHSPLIRVLRLRQQTERMARLRVSHARNELNSAEDNVKAAQLLAARQTAYLESRLQSPGASLMVQLSQLDLAAVTEIVRRRLVEQSAAAERLNTSVDAYRVAQREREVVEKAVARHLDEHRRSNARAAAVELQEWSLRTKTSS